MVTAIPRAIYNHVTYKEVEVLSFLKGQVGVNPKLIDSERVNLKMDSIRKLKYRVKIERSVHFIELPDYPRSRNCNLSFEFKL